MKPALLGIDRFWREGGGCYLSGWMHANSAEIVQAHFCQDEGGTVDVLNTHPRPDLCAYFPAVSAEAANRAGFVAFLPRHAGSNLQAVLRDDHGETYLASYVLPPMEPDGTLTWPDHTKLAIQGECAWQAFVAEVNRPDRDVLQVGGRLVTPGAPDLRPIFSSARRYSALDIHPAQGIDYVGDVHFLSRIVGCSVFDAIFSSAVLEHLAMPWFVAAEMNRALRLGGIVYHKAPQCWPIHERPNDFFRFSDQALRVLFGPAYGFEPIDAGMMMPMAVYQRDKSVAHFDQTPLHPAFGMAWILSRKVVDLPPTAAPDWLETLSRQYPSPV
jgi:hypothetical protein